MPIHKLASTAPIAFTAHDSGDNPIDASALTFAVRVIRSDGSSAAGGASGGINHGITQPDVSNALGCCYYTPVAGDFTVAGNSMLRISATGMKTREILVEVVGYDKTDGVRMGLTALRPDAALIGTAVTGTLTATSFSTNLTLPNGQLQGAAYCRFTTGTLAGQVQKITTYSSGILTFTTGFSVAPSNGDQFEIVNG